jgi:hypothetical protein
MDNDGEKGFTVRRQKHQHSHHYFKQLCRIDKILIALRCDEASCTSTTTCNIVPNHLAVVWQVFHPKFYWAACSPIIHIEPQKA